MDWHFTAFITSFLTALYIHSNHLFKLDGLKLVFLRSITVSLGGLIALPWLTLPDSTLFYIFCLLCGIFVTAADVNLFNVAAHHGGRLISLFIPMKMFIIFFLWLFIKPETSEHLFAQPLIALGVLACFGLTFWALLGIRKNDVCWAAVIAIIPTAIFLSFTDIVSKLGLSIEPFSLSLTATFFWLGAVSTAFFSGLWLKWHKVPFKRLFTAENLKASTVVSTIFFFMVMGFLISVTFAPNPAYVGAITVLSTVWLSIYSKLFKNESANWESVVALTASAIALTALTA